LNASNGTTAGSNVILHVGSSGGVTELRIIKNQHEFKNEEIAAKPLQTNVCAYLEPQRWLDTRKKIEAKKCPISKADEQGTCHERKDLKKLEIGGNMFPPVQKTYEQTNQVMTTNSKRSSDLVWRREQSSKFLGVADKTKKNYVTPDPEREHNAPSISSLSTTHTHVQSSESISMATSESDINAVSVSSISSPTSSVTQSQPETFTTSLFEQPNVEVLTQNYNPYWAAYSSSCALPFGAPRGCSGNSSYGKSQFTNRRGELVILSKRQVDMRLRQLRIGKESWGYQNYVRAVPKNNRSRWHPMTPDPLERISKRRFNGKVNVWRRKLHYWDAPRTETLTPVTHQSIESVMPDRLAYENKEEKVKYVREDNKAKTRDGETQLHGR